jgi:hypothetical protein
MAARNVVGMVMLPVKGLKPNGDDSDVNLNSGKWIMARGKAIRNGTSEIEVERFIRKELIDLQCPIK